MSSNNIRHLLEKMILLESDKNDAEPGIYREKNNVAVELDRLRLYDIFGNRNDYVLEEHLRHTRIFIEKACQKAGVSRESIAPLVQEYYEQLKFYAEYARDIVDYFNTHRLVITEPEYLKIEELIRRDYILTHPTSKFIDPLGIVDENNRGVIINEFQRQLTVILDILKARGIKI